MEHSEHTGQVAGTSEIERDDDLNTEDRDTEDPDIADWDIEDQDMSALPSPPKGQRTVSVVLMSVATIVACLMCWFLRSEFTYAIADAEPAEVGDLASLDLSSTAANQYVDGRGKLEPKAVVQFSRPLEVDSFRVYRVVDGPKVFVETRVPDGVDASGFAAPSSFAGRLVKLSQAGVRYRGVADSVARETGEDVSLDVWLLVDGASPQSSRWAFALVVLFGLFGFWSVGSLVWVLRPVR